MQLHVLHTLRYVGAALAIIAMFSVSAGVSSAQMFVADYGYSPYYYATIDAPGSVPAVTVPQFPTGSISTSLHNGAPGTSVTVAGSGFPRNSIITIYFGSAAVQMVVSDVNGNFQTNIVVPNLPAGLVAVTATGANPLNPPTFNIDANIAYAGARIVSTSYVQPGIPNTGLYIADSRHTRARSTSSEVAELQQEITSLQKRLERLIERLNSLLGGR